MTAVEWLADQLGINEIVADPIHSGLIRIFAEAKQMEANQIISAHESASLDAGFENSARDWAEDYYKLKFKKK
jgi:hypothetical protein